MTSEQETILSIGKLLSRILGREIYIDKAQQMAKNLRPGRLLPERVLIIMKHMMDQYDPDVLVLAVNIKNPRSIRRFFDGVLRDQGEQPPKEYLAITKTNTSATNRHTTLQLSWSAEGDRIAIEIEEERKTTSTFSVDKDNQLLYTFVEYIFLFYRTSEMKFIVANEEGS